MEYKIFLKLLKEANLSKDKFMELSKTKFGTFKGWGTERQSKKTPEWTESWLNLYIENKKKDIVIEALRK